MSALQARWLVSFSPFPRSSTASSMPSLFPASLTLRTPKSSMALHSCCDSWTRYCIPVSLLMPSSCRRLAALPGSDCLSPPSISCRLHSLMAVTFFVLSVPASTAIPRSSCPLFSCCSGSLVSGTVGTSGVLCFSLCDSSASPPFTIRQLSIAVVAGERSLLCSFFSFPSCPRRSTFLQVLVDRRETPVMIPRVCPRTVPRQNANARTDSHTSASRSSASLHRLRHRLRHLSNAWPYSSPSRRLRRPFALGLDSGRHPLVARCTHLRRACGCKPRGRWVILLHS